MLYKWCLVSNYLLMLVGRSKLGKIIRNRSIMGFIFRSMARRFSPFIPISGLRGPVKHGLRPRQAIIIGYATHSRASVHRLVYSVPNTECL